MNSGESLGRYRIIRRLGAGGMGVVYEAEDLRLTSRHVALKFLSPEISREPGLVDRLRREALQASALNHPNICTIHDIDRTGDEHFIVMELLQGRTLAEAIDGTPLSADAVIHVSAQIADALTAVHLRDIVHRDVKPANIFLTDSGHAKILDFGLAKPVPRPSGTDSAPHGGAGRAARLATARGLVPGTPAYMSPEQVRGEPLDGRSDVWSLGCSMYEMATGRPPFTGAGASETFDRILQTDPAPPDEVNAAIDKALADVIMRALRKDATERYASAAELKRDLEAIRLRRRAWWTARTWLLASAVLAVALGLAIWRSSTAPPAPERHTILITGFENHTADPIFEPTLARALAMALEQSPYLTTMSEDRIRATLERMGRPAETVLGGAVGREICERAGAAVMLQASIAGIGDRYVVQTEAVDCRSGEPVARAQSSFARREEVLRAIAAVAARLRRALGESYSSIRRYDRPLPEVTTASLEALRLYSLGHDRVARGRQREAVPLFLGALELDPQFALAHGRLATIYGNLGIDDRAQRHAIQAYALRDRLTERERLYVTQRYHSEVTGDMHEWEQALQQYKYTYPRDTVPLLNLGVLYGFLGRQSQAIAETSAALEIDPHDRIANENLTLQYIESDRLADARAVIAAQRRESIETTAMYRSLYTIALLEGDGEGMRRAMAWIAGNEPLAAAELRQEIALRKGRLAEARLLTEQLVEDHLGRDEAVAAAQRLVALARHEALAGAFRHAVAASERALVLTNDPYVHGMAAFPLALAGSARADALMARAAAELSTRTIYIRIRHPLARAARALARGEPARADELLRTLAPYEFGDVTEYYVAYLRGRSLQERGAFVEADAEWQRIIDRRGVEPFGTAWVLAHLQQARAAARLGDVERSRRRYDEFLALWKEADGDLTVVAEARRERAQLDAPPRP